MRLSRPYQKWLRSLIAELQRIGDEVGLLRRTVIEQTEAIQQTTESADRQNQTLQGIRAELEIPPAITEQYRGDERNKNRREWARFLVEIATLLCVAWYAVTAYRQWGEMSNQSQILSTTGRESRSSSARQFALTEKQLKGTLEQMKAQTEAQNKAASASGESATQARSQSRLDTAIARVQYGAAIVKATPWMGFYYEGNHIHVIVAISNWGTRTAQAIQIGGRVEFRDSPPKDWEYKSIHYGSAVPSALAPNDPKKLFRSSDAGSDLSVVNAYAVSNPIVMALTINHRDEVRYGGRTVYAWGVIKYADFMDQQQPFCRKARASGVFKDGATGQIVETDCGTNDQ